MDHAESKELRNAARVAVVAALTVIAAFVASKAARDAILLSSFHIEDFPLFVGISAALSLPMVVLAGRAFARYGPTRLLPLLNVASAGLLVGEWALLAHAGHPRMAAAIVFLHLGSLGAVLVSGFWSVVNERFDLQSAKRYVGRIGMGATIGGILGGLVAERTAVLLRQYPGAILLVLAALQLVCAIALRVLGAGRRDRKAASSEDVATLDGLRTIARIPLLRNLGVVVLLGAIGAAALDYVFKAQVVAEGRANANVDTLRVLALYHTGTSILTALMQIGLARAVVTRLGVARTISSLPLAVTGFGLTALFVPSAYALYSAMAARGAEAITRSSIYRAGYELLFAPLPDRDKRSTKVVLDVGAERIGDLLGSQLVLLLLYTADPHTAILSAAVVLGVVTLAFATRVPGAYAGALELSLVDRASDGTDEVPAAASMTWTAFGSTAADAGTDLAMMSMLDLRATGAMAAANTRPSEPKLPPAIRKHPELAATEPADLLVRNIAALRQRDRPLVRQILGRPLHVELVPHVIPLLAWNEVAREVHDALSAIAPRCTGALVDAMLDKDRDFTIRRRLPAVVAAGEPHLAAWGLWRGLSDARFEVRYRCGRALTELRARDHALPMSEAQIHELLQRELEVEASVTRGYQLIDSDDTVPPGELASAGVSTNALAHIFNLLSLALPPEPVRIAFRSLYTDDRQLRATALEYIEVSLPAELSTKLCELIELERPQRSNVPRSKEEITAALKLSQPFIEAHVSGRNR